MQGCKESKADITAIHARIPGTTHSVADADCTHDRFHALAVESLFLAYFAHTREC